MNQSKLQSVPQAENDPWMAVAWTGILLALCLIVVAVGYGWGLTFKGSVAQFYINLGKGG